MSIKHIVLVKWKTTATVQQRTETISRLLALPDQIPQIRSYVVEENIGPDASNFDLAIMGEFDDVASYEAYRDHPAHQDLIRKSTIPTLETRAAIQISC